MLALFDGQPFARLPAAAMYTSGSLSTKCVDLFSSYWCDTESKNAEGLIHDKLNIKYTYKSQLDHQVAQNMILMSE